MKTEAQKQDVRIYNLRVVLMAIRDVKIGDNLVECQDTIENCKKTANDALKHYDFG